MVRDEVRPPYLVLQGLLVAMVLFAMTGGAVANDDDDDYPEYTDLRLPSSDVYYVGRVGKNMRIQMALSLHGKGKHGSRKIHGSYFYDSIGAPLQLDGVLKAGTLSLTEQEDEKVTGRFTGEFNPRAARQNLKWSSPDGSRSLDVSLTLVAESERLREDRSGVISAVVEWPTFRGKEALPKAVERTLKKDAQRAIKVALQPDPEHGPESDGGLSVPWTIQTQHTVLYYSPTLISLQTYDHSYMGGAHGSYDFGGRCFVLRDGRAHELTLKDLFRPGSKFVRRLSDLCIAGLQKKGASGVPDGEGEGLKLKDLATFQVTPEGLTFIFNPYTMGCYAEGGYWVDVPWKRISDLLADVPEIRHLAGMASKPPRKQGA